MSKFVSGGTIDKPIERDEEWRAAQAEVEAAHLNKLKEGEQQGGKSLYEVLQANKAAKQEAFEESIRLKNQFRSLDDDEIQFLDKVLESTRAKEDAVRKETSEQLESFRRQREDAEKSILADEATVVEPVEEEQWATGRKRKKGKETESLIKGLKNRKLSGGAERGTPASVKAQVLKREGATVQAGSGLATSASPPAKAAKGLQSRIEHAPYSPATQPPKIVAGPDTKSQPATQLNKPVALHLGDYSSDEE